MYSRHAMFESSVSEKKTVLNIKMTPGEIARWPMLQMQQAMGIF